MPKLSKLNTWGRFFGLNLELEHSETNGYSIKSTSRFRLPPYQGFENYLNQHFSPESIDYVLNQKTIPVFKSLERVYFEDHNDEIEIKSISDELGKEVGILELNFDQVTYKSSAGLFTKEVDINKLVLENCYPQFHKSLGISKNDLFNALNTAPVIPSDSVSYMANLLIFKTLIGDFIDRGEVKEQLLVVTGEMVWSGWLSLLGISEFLLRTIMDNKEIIIDQYAIWPLITRISKQEPELLMLNSSFFKPNLYAINDYYVDKKDSAVIVEDFFKDRKFYLNEKKANLFILDKNSPDTQFVLISSGRVPKIDFSYNHAMLSAWWTYDDWDDLLLAKLDVPVFKRTYSDTSVVKYKKPQQLDLKIEDYISAGSKIGTNSELGDIYLDYSNIENLRDRLNCVDGQIVRAGDIILELKKTAIFGSKQIKAPVTGRVDFSLVDKGILIFKESKSEEVTIPFGGIYLSQDTTHLRIKTKTMNLFTSFHIGNITQGILIAKKDIERVVGEKILFLNRMSEYDLDFEKAQEQGIKGVMFLSLGFEEMLYMITKKEVQMGIVDLIICDQIGDSYRDDTLLSFIRKYYGYYISVEEGVIKIPVAKNNKFASPELQEDHFQIACHKRLLKGEKIKVISYFDSHHYARIESISKNFVSVSNNSEILSINKANIYQYES